MSTAAPSKQKDHALALGRLLALVSRITHESRYSRNGFVLVDRVDLMALGSAHRQYLAAISKAPVDE